MQEITRLDKALMLLADLAGKQLDPMVLQFYSRELRPYPFERIGAVLAEFGREGRWPTIKEILQQCDVRPTGAETVSEVKETAREPENYTPPKGSDPIVCWMKDAEMCGDDLKEASMLFDVFQQRLERAGWNVFKVDKHRVKMEVQTEVNGKHFVDCKWIYKGLFFAIK